MHVVVHVRFSKMSIDQQNTPYDQKYSQQKPANIEQHINHLPIPILQAYEEIKYRSVR